jgi:putative nucleotidyltransferase with HDIG domain
MESHVRAAHEIEAEVERRLATGPLELPMLPTVATQILAGGLNESADIRALSELLQRDQTLAGHALRVANSAAYGGSTRIQTIQQALFRIGLAQMREIVVAVALHCRVFRGDGHPDLVAELWRHSALAGLCAKEIARKLRCNVEGAFVCGLLHDVGKPVVLTLLFEAGTRSKTPVSRERCVEILGRHHAAVGRVLAEGWALPEQVVASIAHHHAPEAAARHALAANVTCLADLLAHAVVAGDAAGGIAADALYAHPVCAALNLYPEDVDELLARRAALRDLAGTFSA